MINLLDSSDIKELVISIWRLEKRIENMKEKISENEYKALSSILTRQKNFLQKMEILIIDYEGKKYNEGITAKIVAREKSKDVTQSYIKETIEPTITMGKERLTEGKIVLVQKEGDSDEFTNDTNRD